MYKLISSSRDSDHLSIGFQRSIEARERELTNNKTTKGNYHVRIYLEDVCVLSQLNGTDAENLALAGRVIINDLSWYIYHYTPSISKQKLMLEHIISKSATELSYIKRSS